MPSLEDAYAHCHAIVADRAKNFLYAFKLLPQERRQALEAIYAYCRLADDFADDDGLETAERARKLADLRRRLARACGAPDPGGDAPLPENPEVDPLMLALGDAVRRFGVGYDDLDQVAKGCEQDLEVLRYEDFEGLYGYCYQVASAVGLACLDVFGYSGDRASARELAEALGIAMQLTNITRDVTEDLERDRVYLPQEDLRRFGVSEADLARGEVTPAVRALIQFQVERAEGYFAQGARLAPRVLRASRVCPLALASIYRALLREVERRDYDVFSERVSLSSGRKLALMLLSMGRAFVTRGAS